MRLDHIAYRVAQGKRDEAAKFFVKAFGYKLQGDPFEIYFDDKKIDIAFCLALEPPEKVSLDGLFPPWEFIGRLATRVGYSNVEGIDVSYHMAPEIFISEGTESSIVGKWVKSRGGVGGIHHLAYSVSDVERTMKEWSKSGVAEFSSSEPMKCPGITQIFSKENITGVVFELIKREGDVGFCKDNVKELMIASKSD